VPRKASRPPLVLGRAGPDRNPDLISVDGDHSRRYRQIDVRDDLVRPRVDAGDVVRLGVYRPDAAGARGHVVQPALVETRRYDADLRDHTPELGIDPDDCGGAVASDPDRAVAGGFRTAC